MAVSVNNKVATSFDMSSPGDIGSVTPGSGTFTTLSTTQDAVINGVTVGAGSGTKNTIVGGGGAGAALLAASGNSVYGYAAGSTSGAAGDNNIVISNGNADQLWYKDVYQPYTNTGVWRSNVPIFSDYAMINGDEAFYNVAEGFLSMSANVTGISNVSIGALSLSSLNPRHGIFTSISDLGGGTLRFHTSSTDGLSNGDYVVVYRTANYNVAFNISNVVLDTSFDATGLTFYSSESGRWAKVFEGIANCAIGYSSAAHLTTGSSNIVIGDSTASSLTTGNGCIVIGDQVDCSNADNQVAIGNYISVLRFDASHWYFDKPVKKKIASYSAASSTLAETDDVIYLDATGNNVDIALPPANTFAAGYTKTFRFRRIDGSSNTCTLTPDGTDTINGAAGAISILTGWYLDLEVNATGDGWFVF